MRQMEDNSIDFIVTDPPYGLHFMGKTWDKFKKSNFDERGNFATVFENGKERKVRKIGSANHQSGEYDSKRDDEFQEFMRLVGIEMLRILKPGGHVAMFGSPRRHHRQMSGLEDAGFEIRDCIAWIFGSGFPKSHNFGRKLGGEWKGFGTALKPAYEPIIIAMKPLDGTFAQNAEKWGVGGINIDSSRIGSEEIKTCAKEKGSSFTHLGNGEGYNGCPESIHKGRWPANLILSEESAEELDRMTSQLKSGHRNRENYKSSTDKMSSKITNFGSMNPSIQFQDYNDSGGASRFFYCPKASSSERNKGLEGMIKKTRQQDGDPNNWDLSNGTVREKFTTNPQANHHPTVKPIALMKYIITLLAPPGNPTCLDPFMGSGSTGVACKELGVSFIGIEKEKEYVEIAEKRIGLN